MCRARAARRASPRCSSSPPTRRRSGRARRRSRPISAVGEHLRGLSGRRRRPSCARRSAARSASIPTASSAARAPTICSTCWRAPISRDGDEAIHTTHGFLVYPIATLGAGATPVVAPEKDYTADVDAILERGDADAPRSCSSPTRTIRPAPTCRSTRSSACIAALPPHVLLVLDAAYAEYVRAQRLRGRHRAGRDQRERRDDAAPSRRSTASRRCGSAGCTARRMSSMRSTASAGRSTSTRRRSRPASRRSRTPRMSRTLARAQRRMAARG